MDDVEASNLNVTPAERNYPASLRHFEKRDLGRLYVD